MKSCCCHNNIYLITKIVCCNLKSSNLELLINKLYYTTWSIKFKSKIDINVLSLKIFIVNAIDNKTKKKRPNYKV